MRARDADRNEVVEALEAAFVDGQLSTDEREQRVAAAFDAVDLDDLRALVRDLQNAPEQFRPGVVASVRAVATSTKPQTRAGIGAVLIAVALAAWACIAVLADDDQQPSAPTPFGEQIAADPEELDADPVATADQFSIMWSTVRDELTSGQPANQREGRVPALDPWKVNAAKVDKLFEVIHNQFDTPYLHELSLRADSVNFSRPLKGSQPRTEDWYLDKEGNVRASEPTVESGRDMTLFDTRDIDVKALFANLKTALASLEVEDAKLSYISVALDSTTDMPEISIWVDNKYSESAWLVTALDGAVVEQHPFTAP